MWSAWAYGGPLRSATCRPVCLGRVSLVTELQGHFQSCLAPDKHSLCVHARFVCLPVCLHACLFVGGVGGGGGWGWEESRDRTSSTAVKCVFGDSGLGQSVLAVYLI